MIHCNPSKDQDDDDDDDILFMLSNIIKYMQCTMKHERKRDTTTNVKHAESVERVAKEKMRSTAALPKTQTKY